MGLVAEFREFAAKGDVVDLAVGVVIGAAFAKIVTAFVDDIVMPPIGLALGGANFADKFAALDGKTYASLADAKAKGGAVLAYGDFITVVMQFLIIAFAIFLAVKAVNKLRREPAPAPAVEAAPPADVALLTEIRDLLKAR